MGLREQVSLLMAHGHPAAARYPLPGLWTETRLVARRVNRQTATEAILLQMAVSSVLSKDAGKAFKERVEDLTKG